MKKIIILFILSCGVLSHLAYACKTGDCILKNRSDDQACELGDGPLTRCEKFEQFVNEDKKLNEAYKSLKTKLDKESFAQLRLTQRSWIKWRDETCENAEENVGCNNGVCAGVEHDGCIVKLTRVRAQELREFRSNLIYAKKTNFQYARKYDGWLEY